MTTSEQSRRVHPALFIVAFFAVLFVLQGAFFIVASVQPDDRILPLVDEAAQVDRAERAEQR